MVAFTIVLPFVPVVGLVVFKEPVKGALGVVVADDAAFCRLVPGATKPTARRLLNAAQLMPVW